jgi:hypothetical protein
MAQLPLALLATGFLDSQRTVERELARGGKAAHIAMLFVGRDQFVPEGMPCQHPKSTQTLLSSQNTNITTT